MKKLLIALLLALLFTFVNVRSLNIRPQTELSPDNRYLLVVEDLGAYQTFTLQTTLGSASDMTFSPTEHFTLEAHISWTDDNRVQVITSEGTSYWRIENNRLVEE
jgi:hypothetical protein